jgi:dehydrogenase/reductase SDR family member 12
MALCEERADAWRGTGVVVHAMHPGWSDSPGIREALPGFLRAIGPILRTPQEGPADEPTATSGQLWLDRRPRAIHRLARTADSRVERRYLLEECARLAGAGDAALAGGTPPGVR